MKTRLRALALLLALLAWRRGVRCEEPATPPVWKISAAGTFYSLPDEKDLFIPVLYAKRGPLHLEARYEYEQRGAGSLFGGWTLEHEGTLQVEATLMAGVVVGSLDGIAPGFELSLGYRKLHWYTEAEYVFDLADSDSNFFYGWSELSYVPVERFRVGLTTQRTKVIRTERDIDRGLHLGWTVRNVAFTAHVMDPDDPGRYYVLAVAAEF